MGEAGRATAPVPASPRVVERTGRAGAACPLAEAGDGDLEGRNGDHQRGADVTDIVEQAEDDVQLAADKVPQ
jgi:hypothetical protein